MEEECFSKLVACLPSLLPASSSILLLGNYFAGIRTHFFGMPMQTEDQQLSRQHQVDFAETSRSCGLNNWILRSSAFIKGLLRPEPVNHSNKSPDHRTKDQFSEKELLSLGFILWVFLFTVWIKERIMCNALQHSQRTVHYEAH